MEDNNGNVGIKVPLTEYTQHIVKESVAEAMKMHLANCPLSKTVADLSVDMWGDASHDGVKAKVKTLELDYVSRKENVGFIKKPFFSGLVGALFVGLGFLLKGAWLWFIKKV